MSGGGQLPLGAGKWWWAFSVAKAVVGAMKADERGEGLKWHGSLVLQ